jgi:hypothetical protein
MYRRNFPERKRLRQEGVLRRLARVVTLGSKRTQEQLDHERAALTKAVSGGSQTGVHSKKDHSFRAKVR